MIYMYNTIEVIFLEITSAQIKMLKKSGFDSAQNENEKHVKILPYLSVVQSVEGSYDIALGNGETQQTGDGGFFIAPANVQQTIVHHVNQTSKKMTCRWIFLEVEVNRSFPLERLYQFPVVINDCRKTKLNALFDRLFATDNVWKNYSDCYALIDFLLESAVPMPTEPNQGIQRVIEYVAEHYKNPISIKTLSGIANMSESNFYAAFKKHKGISPIAYLNRYRLSVAADKLMETTATISEISYSVGIHDSLYFSKLFKKTYGVAPKEYRMAYHREV